MKNEAAEDNLYQYFKRDICVLKGLNVDDTRCFHPSQFHVKISAFLFPGKGIINRYSLSIMARIIF